MDVTRRRIALTLSQLGLLSNLSIATAAGLIVTPQQGRGPFYPRSLPLDRDNDLISVAGQQGTASGVHTNVIGQIRNRNGEPIENALVEIWQCDAFGKYHHPGDRRSIERDPKFQGYGQFMTGANGNYRFRTIQPVAYPGRAPHIHFAVRAKGRRELVTQMYVRGAPENSGDYLLGSADDPLHPLVVTFERNPDDTAERLARFNLTVA